MQKVYSPKVRTEFSHQTAAQLRISTTVWVDFFSLFSFFKKKTSQRFNFTRQWGSQSFTHIFLISFSPSLCAHVFDLCGSAGHRDARSAPQYPMVWCRETPDQRRPPYLIYKNASNNSGKEKETQRKLIRETRGSWNKVDSCLWRWNTRWQLKKVLSFMIRLLMLTVGNYWQH